MFWYKFSIKNYIKAALTTVFFAAFILYLPTERGTISYSGYSITYASLQADILKTAYIDGIKEIHGVMVTDYDHQKVEYYFEYEANALDTLRIVGSLPFRLDDNVSSLECMLMESSTNPLELNAAFSDEVRKGTSFFWDSRAEDFTFYECIKSPMKHTLLISKISNKILHHVEIL